jgi:hypothetical protein
MLSETVAAEEEIFGEIFRDCTQIFYSALCVWRDVGLCPHCLTRRRTGGNVQNCTLS